ncbi:MAG: hypothetical protein FWD47_11810 [Treponema sp.]|nr:hypothetical protein [Treponema sp.]
MKKLTLLVIIFVFISTACEQNNFISYDIDRRPTEREIKKVVLKSLQGISAEPKSIDIRDVYGPYYSSDKNQYGNDTGWIALINFNWVNMRGQRERQMWYFAITNNIGIDIPDQNKAKEAFERYYTPSKFLR